MNDVYAALAECCEQAAAKGRRNSAETVMGLSTRCRFDTSIGDMLRALARYADDHAKQYDSPIAEDGVLGSDWEVALRAVVNLLNGETGRLDCGDVDHAARAMYRAAGFEEEL
jgi:hypothetical protein